MVEPNANRSGRKRFATRRSEAKVALTRYRVRLTRPHARGRVPRWWVSVSATARFSFAGTGLGHVSARCLGLGEHRIRGPKQMAKRQASSLRNGGVFGALEGA